jgi:multimeric flavodoxin WrbA
MAKKVIALLGSPVHHGNTAKLLDQAIKGAEDAGCEVEKVMVPHLDFNPCMETFYCKEHDTCQMLDDVTPFYEGFRAMDGIIIATPVMTMGIPGKLKSFMDRFQVYYMAKYVRKEPFIAKSQKKHRKGLFIAIAGMNVPQVFDGAKLTVKAFFDIIDCEYWDELLRNDMDTIRDVSTQQALMDAAYLKGLGMGKILNEQP